MSVERWAEVVLVSPQGVLLGKLPPVRTELPWWPEVASLVRAVREQHALNVTVLRLLHAEREEPNGGRVTYLAEVEPPVRCEPCAERLDEHPLRQAYASPGGPRRDLEWAARALSAQGYSPAGQAEQIKTWNLSSVWCIPLSARAECAHADPAAGGPGADRRAWLKVVPAFFAHEGPLIAALARYGGVPRLLGVEPGRALLADIPGADGFHATLEQRRCMIDLLVRLVNECRPALAELLALGLRDFRAPALSAAMARSFERHRHELAAPTARLLSTFLTELDARWARLAQCGLPDGLIHGDFHSGNVRVDGQRLTLIDWGDAGVGHPLLDAAAFLEHGPEEQLAPLRQHFQTAWQRALPGCDAQRAERWIAPIAAARQAVIYDEFLDHIEPSEHPYHRADPARWLARAARAFEREQHDDP